MRRRHAEHPIELAERDLDADAGQEADEHRPRDEVGEEAEPREPGEDEERGGEERRKPGKRGPLWCVRLQTCDAERRDAGVEDRRRRRVAADDEMTRGGED